MSKSKLRTAVRFFPGGKPPGAGRDPRPSGPLYPQPMGPVFIYKTILTLYLLSATACSD